MYTLLIIIHLLVCIFLILVILLQTGRGSDIGAVFGGGASQTLFGSAGPGTFLGRLTTVMAAIFMLTSLALAAGLFQKEPASIVEEMRPKVVKEGAVSVPQKATPEEKEKGKEARGDVGG